MGLNGYYDVTEFGAKGNGTHNDAPNIQAAINACAGASVPSSPGGVVYFPPGTYAVNSTSGPALTISTSGVELRGAGVGSSVIEDISPRGTTYTPTIVHVSGGAANVKIRNIQFQGNNQHYTSTPAADTASSQSTLHFNSGNSNKVEDCYFTQNRSYTIWFDQVKDAHVSGSRFYDVGYSNSANVGDSFRTDAIYANSGSLGVNVHNNTLATCNYGGIALDTNQGDASHNRAYDCTVTMVYIRAGHQDNRAAFNGTQGDYIISGSAGGPIYAESGSNATCLIGNLATEAQADGISIAAIANTIVMGNNAVDCNTYTGDSGLQINPQTDQLSQGIIAVGNNLDENGSPVGMATGIKIFLTVRKTTTYPYMGSSVIAGNNPYMGYENIDIVYSGDGGYHTLQDDSNTVLGNQYWLDRIHTNKPVPASGTSVTTLAAVTVNPDTMLERGGMRVIAAGGTTGTTNRTFNVGFGPTSASATNILSGVTFKPSSGTSSWAIILCVANNNEASAPRNQQSSIVQLYGDGNLITSATVPLLINTDATNYIYIQASNGSGDSLTADFVLAERY